MKSDIVFNSMIYLGPQRDTTREECQILERGRPKCYKQMQSIDNFILFFEVLLMKKDATDYNV